MTFFGTKQCSLPTAALASVLLIFSLSGCVQEVKRTKSSEGPPTLENVPEPKKSKMLNLSIEEVMAKGRDYLDENNLKLARLYFTRALAIDSGSPKALTGMGEVLRQQGHFEEAESLFREALEMREALFGPDHPKVALTVNNLALVHRRQAHYRRAEPLFHRALSIRRTQLGKEHVSVAISLFGLAGLLHRTDRRRPALDAYEEALALFRTHLGRHHSFVARTQMGIGSVHLDLGNSDAAAESLRTGFDRVRRIHSDSSIEYALGAGRLGRFHLERGDTSRAKSLLTEGLTTLKAIEKSVTPRQQILARHLTRLAPDP